MNRRVLLGAALLSVAAVACTDSVTNPSLLSVERSSYSVEGDPPPPPMDSTMATYDGQSMFSINVTYFFSKTGNNAWLSFNRDQDQAVTISPNARIAVSSGRAAARGTMSIQTTDGVWFADLSKAIDARSLEAFGACKYECAKLSLTGTLTYPNGEFESKALKFQFQSTRGEVDVKGDNH